MNLGHGSVATIGAVSLFVLIIPLKKEVGGEFPKKSLLMGRPLGLPKHDLFGRKIGPVHVAVVMPSCESCAARNVDFAALRRRYRGHLLLMYDEEERALRSKIPQKIRDAGWVTGASNFNERLYSIKLQAPVVLKLDRDIIVGRDE
jgi:hypothetical protein